MDDRIVKITSRRLIGSDAAHHNDDDVDDDDVNKVLSVSRTRSGRMSRPPTQHDDDEYHQYRLASTSTSASQNAATNDVIVVNDASPESMVDPLATVAAPIPKPKRKLSVPPRYRCRVCHKTYLGNFFYFEACQVSKYQKICSIFSHSRPYSHGLLF